ncbi:MAG: glycosyl hydrolase [Puia sp.]|nr:glycosyl hydrolase [Puia sp.]
MKSSTLTKILTLVLLLTAIAADSQPKFQPSVDSSEREPAPDANPETVFRTPPASASPGVLWMWMGSNLSKQGITKDLEALKQEGFSSATMLSLADITTPWACNIDKSPTPDIIAWTEPWWKLVRHAAEESRRLGMSFGMFNGPAYETSGGPWVTPELSMQEVCWSQQAVQGNTRVSVKLARPQVDPRANMPFPVYNPATGLVERPEIAARKTWYKDIAVLAVPARGVIPVDSIFDLTARMQPDGSLDWDAPKGEWLLYRFGHTTMGAIIQPAQWAATGLECDKMNVEAVSFHIDHVIGEIQKHLGDLIGNGFDHVYFDSYEAGYPTWTPKMREEFKSRRGYDIIPWLPVFANRSVGGRADSLKFRTDFDSTVRDLYRDVYFRTISAKLRAANLNFLSEPYGGPWRQEEVMPMVGTNMGEFWTYGGVYSPYELEPTIAGLRRSGKNLLQAEAFTGHPNDSKWRETPAWLKPIGDAAFCAGVNRIVIHRFAQQPWDDRYKPGATMGQWGSHFDRTQTWWKPAAAAVKYWQRAQALLQWGRFVPRADDDFVVLDKNSDAAIRYIHRREDKTEVYFVANVSHEPGTAFCSFKVQGMQPELWDPVTGDMRKLTQFETADSVTSLTLRFADAQSYFIVFREKAAQPLASGDNFPYPQELLTLGGPWQVRFDSVWGGPARAVSFAKLDDWTTRPEKGIRYFSGTAVYHKSFDVSSSVRRSQQDLYLDLGTVDHIAHVILNDKDLGVAWTAPWQVRIPKGLLKQRGNRLVIEVTNTWANRLIGDEQEPADCKWLPGFMGGTYLKEFPDWFLNGTPRPSKGRYCFTTWNYFTKDSPLLPSGLMGPVRILGLD